MQMGIRAPTHRELIQEWIWGTKGSSLELSTLERVHRVLELTFIAYTAPAVYTIKGSPDRVGHKAQYGWHQQARILWKLGPKPCKEQNKTH